MVIPLLYSVSDFSECQIIIHHQLNHMISDNSNSEISFFLVHETLPKTTLPIIFMSTCFSRGFAWIWCARIMITSSNGNIFRVTGPLCGEFTCHRWMLLTQASDAELWWVFLSVPWIHGWMNNRKTGDLRRHRAHYGVIVMWCCRNPNFEPLWWPPWGQVT